MVEDVLIAYNDSSAETSRRFFRIVPIGFVKRLAKKV